MGWMFIPAHCFEPFHNRLFGFDVLVDDTLRPWLLEVNFAPSLNVDGALDLNIKSELLADLFTLAGVTPFDPRKEKAIEARIARELERDGPS